MANMQKRISDAGDVGLRGVAPALVGLLLCSLGDLLVAQAGGSDRETFLSIGLLFGAVGLLGMIIGGVAIGVQMARE
jgi:hypothetical protein